MKAIILARVSTEEQKEAGNSLPAQMKRLKQYVSEQDNLTCWKEFSFDESAYKSENRKEFDQIVKLIKSSDETVALCCDKVDRLMRNFLKELPQLEKMRDNGDLILHFPSDHLVLEENSSAQELFQFNMAVSLAQYYSDSISDNVRRAFEKKRENGEWHGQAPFGYKNIENTDGTRENIVPDPETAPVVKEMYKKYATGDYSYPKLAEMLNDRGIKTNRDKEFNVSSIGEVMKNPFYYGVAQSNKYGEYPHVYETIVSKDLWDEVQEVRKKKNNNPVKTRKTKLYIFQGLLECERCGCTMSPEKQKDYVYYSCTGAKGDCKNAHEYARQSKLLNPIKEDIDNLKLTDKQIQKIVSDLKETYQGKAKHTKKRITQLENEQERLNEKLDTLLDMRLDGEITESTYKQKQRKLERRQDEVKQKLPTLKTKHKESPHIDAECVLSLMQRALDIFECSEDDEKRQFVKYLLQNAKVDEKNLEYSLRNPFDTVVSVGGDTIRLRRLDSNQ